MICFEIHFWERLLIRLVNFEIKLWQSIKLSFVICSKKKKYKINFIHENVDLFDHTDTIMICLKPKDIFHVLGQVAKKVNKSHLMLSLAAGIQLKQIEQVNLTDCYIFRFFLLLIFNFTHRSMTKVLCSDARVIRIMTNLPALVQEGCSVYSKGTNVTEGKFYFERCFRLKLK